MNEKKEEIIEDITAEVETTLAQDTNYVSADAALKTTQRELGGKEAERKALYKTSGGRTNERKREEAAVGEVQSKMICVNRITKVVKGGRTLRFNAVVIVGDKNGRVGVGNGKAREVTEAIKKAEQDGKKNFINVPIVGKTIPHEVSGVFGTSQVLLFPAKEGHGIIAGGPVKSVLELAGYLNVTAKCHGSTTKTNVVKAVVEGLSKLRTREQIMTARGVKH